MHPRRSWLRLALLWPPAIALASVALATACAGAPTRLVTVKTGTSQGAVQFEVKNLTSVPINNLYLAKSETVPHQLDDNSPEGESVWGGDLLAGAIGMGQRVPIAVAGPGRWDARAVDRDGRYQHVGGLKLEAGGRYILELNDGGWRVR